jgi:adenosylcobyric acid synthase
MLRLGDRTDGCISADGKVFGCYLHGLFASDAFRAAFLAKLRAQRNSSVAYDAAIEDTLDSLAEHLEANLNMDAVLAAAAPLRVLSR